MNVGMETEDYIPQNKRNNGDPASPELLVKVNKKTRGNIRK